MVVTWMPDEIQVTRARAVTWTARNPVLLYGEHGLEKDTGRFKIGNGVSRWNTLEYFIPESEVLVKIQEAIDALPANQGGGPSMADFTNHINSTTPHPIYDEGSGESLLSHYQNSKV